jgi:hypothetical protein
VSQAQLLLTCTLGGSRDCAAVQCLLGQYGLDAERAANDELTARGNLPNVFAEMKSMDIESHLTGRIEDAAPGTSVACIKVTLRRS